MPFERVIEITALPKHGAVKIQVANENLLVFNARSKVLAVSQRCPHLGVPLSPKDVDSAAVVTCWFHGAQFNGLDGSVVREPLSREWQKTTPLGVGKLVAAVIPKKCGELKHYLVELRGTTVWVDVTRVSESNLKNTIG